MIAPVAFVVIFASMLAESRVSARHERALRARGAIEPRGDVYAVMQLAYPGTFLAMILEAVLRDVGSYSTAAIAGVVVFVAAKALKYWAIATLGARWTFRILVPPGSDRIAAGPYRWLRHPNYLAVAGELVGAALWLRAVIAGPLSLLVFGALMLRRIHVEEQALAR